MKYDYLRLGSFYLINTIFIFDLIKHRGVQEDGGSLNTNQEIKMKGMVKFIVIISITFLLVGSVQAGKRDPVAVLFQVKGQVEYSKNGKKWKKIRRNRFLFPGYQVRSLSDGSATVSIKSTGENMMLGPDTTFEVTAFDLFIEKGEMQKTGSKNQLISNLMKKFSNSQSYTTVRRNAAKKELDAVRNLVVTNEHPYLVWENLDTAAQYRLMVGDTTINVAPSDQEIVRVELPPFQGVKPYTIEVLKNDQVIAELKRYKSNGTLKPYTIEWLEEDLQKELKQSRSELIETFGDDSFILGTYYEKMGMWVAAMEHYQHCLQANPEDSDMTPYLFRVYKKLKLEGTYSKELNEWTQLTAN